MNLDTLIRKMVDLEEIIEAGKRAAKDLDECRSIAEVAMDPAVSYRTDFGTVIHGQRLSSYPKLHRITRDCDLYWEVGKRDERRAIVESAAVEIDPELIAGSQIFREEAAGALQG